MHGDPICLDERDFPARINEVLKECDGYPFKHQAFPVVQHTDPEGQLRRGKTRTLRGVISRKQLVQMLANNQAQLELHPSLGIQDGETIASSPVSLIPCTIPIDATSAGRKLSHTITHFLAVSDVQTRISGRTLCRRTLRFRRSIRCSVCSASAGSSSVRTRVRLCRGRVACWLTWVCCSG